MEQSPPVRIKFLPCREMQRHRRVTQELVTYLNIFGDKKAVESYAVFTVLLY